MRTRTRGALKGLVVTSVVLVFLGLMAGPALAKMPPFDLEVIPEGPAPGQTVTVRVSFYNTGQEGERIPVDLGGGPLEGLVGVLPSTALGEDGWIPGEDYAPLTLERVAPGVYEGSFQAPQEGVVGVVPFPGVNAPHVRSSGGYFRYEAERAAELGLPMPVTVTVASATPPPSWWLAAPALVVALGMLAGRRAMLPG